MAIPRWTLFLAALAVSGQEAAPFAPEPADPWRPRWELTLRGDRLSDPGDPTEDFRRAGLQLRLRWAWDQDALHLEAGTRSAMGSDGNRFNAPRWDQQPSNGTQLDLARAAVAWTSERAFASLSAGLQENGLLASQAIWDRDLRFLGAESRVGFRDAAGRVQEAGFRAAAGRVRTVQGGRVDLAAGQAVLQLDTGPLSWTAHVGRWTLAWDPADERLRRLPGHDPAARQRLVLDAAGASGTWHAVFPLEARWFGARNRDTGETSEELQALAGSRERTWWPQLAFTWQRLSSTGTLYPVNGDEWWFYRRARGPRLDLSLPLPGNWIATFVCLRQTAEGEDYRVTRSMLVLLKRF
ncbi:hypothetical protein GETHPA_14920 [Geothrix rubra]|uniref:DUF3187 family protein n=1 Tax=Geothrix rubra TaxID=2927977 RepID=A0ABQ5Q6K2_9BACT|nr:hypothetical protein [Geothrix rubra]GLH69959.1 hypothetical protein GETHPA_14920 [Geothrix rubra]